MYALCIVVRQVNQESQDLPFIPLTDESGQIRDPDRAPLSKGIVLLFMVNSSNSAN